MTRFNHPWSDEADTFEAMPRRRPAGPKPARSGATKAKAKQRRIAERKAQLRISR